MSRRAPSLNGLEAWRVLTRHIDHGRAIHLETLRQDVKYLHLQPIKRLEDVEDEIALFENKLYDYHVAGWPAPQDTDMKPDLLRILHQEIREQLLWHSTNNNVLFS